VQYLFNNSLLRQLFVVSDNENLFKKYVIYFTFKMYFKVIEDSLQSNNYIRMSKEVFKRLNNC